MCSHNTDSLCVYERQQELLLLAETQSATTTLHTAVAAALGSLPDIQRRHRSCNMRWVQPTC